MTKKILTGLALLAIAAAPLLSAAPAHAGLWDFSYSGTGITASGVLTTTDTAVAVGSNSGYQILGISGTRTDGSGSVAIDTVVANPSFPGTTNSPTNNGAYVTFDNALLSPPGFDLYGLFYQTADNSQYNVYDYGGQYYEYLLGSGTSNIYGTPVNVTLTPVSEPSTLAVFGAGVAALAFIKRRRGARTSKLAA